MNKTVSYAFLVLIISLFTFGLSFVQKPDLPAQKVLSQASSSASENIYTVSKVVDGDTIKVIIGGKSTTVRLLGIDTPETVDPRKPVQCYGKIASDKMKDLVYQKEVRLVPDPTQGDKDRYQRLLRYVYLTDARSTFINGEMVKGGYAFSFREYPTKMLDKFNAFETYARENNLGLWGSCPISPTPTP